MFLTIDTGFRKVSE